jgi:hypothetical protein
MKIYVDADACPVVKIVEQVAKENNIPVTLLCDTNHVMDSDYSEVKIIGSGAAAETQRNARKRTTMRSAVHSKN